VGAVLLGVVLTVASVHDAACGEVESGGPVPNFKVKNLAGKSVELSDFTARGPVLIDFWATWCKPCLRELPHVEALREEFGEQGLQVLAVSVDQTRSLSKVKSYVKTHKYGFEVLLDPNQRLLRQLKGTTVPYVLLVSPEGERLFTHTGYREGDEKQLKEVIASVMADFSAGGEEDGEAPAETEDDDNQES
jgi:peroxiredoxin